MKDGADFLICTFWSLFGAFLGFAVFTFGLDGWRYVFTGRSMTIWMGPVGLALALGVGACCGCLAYKFRNREWGSSAGPSSRNTADRVLLVKRLMVLAGSVIALYFIWQLARLIS